MDAGALVGLLGGAVSVVIVLISVLFTLVITALSIAVPLGILFLLFRHMSQSAAAERALLESGASAPATITSVAQTGMYLNHAPQVAISLEVAPLDGPPFTVQLHKFLSLVQIPQVQPGRVVEVRYDPNDHNKVAIVGL